MIKNLKKIVGFEYVIKLAFESEILIISLENIDCVFFCFFILYLSKSKYWLRWNFVFNGIYLLILDIDVLSNTDGDEKIREKGEEIKLKWIILYSSW